MVRVPTELSVAERARWLAELADALEQAQQLMWNLGAEEKQAGEAFDLYARLEAARTEVQALQLSRLANARANPDPNWMDSLWDRGRA